MPDYTVPGIEVGSVVAVCPVHGLCQRFLSRRHCDEMNMARMGEWGLPPRPLFDVLDLLAQFFDLDFDIDRGLTNTHAELVQTGCFGEDGGDLPVHFLK